MRNVARYAAYPFFAAVVPLAVGIATLYPRLPLEPQKVVVDDVPDRPEPPVRDPDKRLAVVLFGNGGTEITDSLPPLEMLAASGRFDVVALAPERAASPLVTAMIRDAGADVLPHYGIAGYEAAIGEDPDVIVVPWLPEFDTTDAELIPWIRDHAGPETVVLSVCAGAKVVAATGLLDGKASTATHGWIPALREEFPRVRWNQDARFVIDGNHVSSNTLTTGIDATLAAVAKLEGREAAERAARVTGYRHLRVLDDPSLELVVGLDSMAFGAWTLDRTDRGFLLEPGVRESAVAAALDTWPHAFADTAVAVGPTRSPVRGRYGLDLIPRATALAELDDVQSLAVPEGGFPYDEMLSRIARAEGAGVAEATAGNIFYAGAGEPIDGRAPWFWWKPIALSLLGLVIAAGLNRKV